LFVFSAWLFSVRDPVLELIFLICFCLFCFCLVFLCFMHMIRLQTRSPPPPTPPAARFTPSHAMLTQQAAAAGYMIKPQERVRLYWDPASPSSQAVALLVAFSYLPLQLIEG